VSIDCFCAFFLLLCDVSLSEWVLQNSCFADHPYTRFSLFYFTDVALFGTSIFIDMAQFGTSLNLCHVNKLGLNGFLFCFVLFFPFFLTRIFVLFFKWKISNLFFIA
jgi:hypothetical protein